MSRPRDARGRFVKVPVQWIHREHNGVRAFGCPFCQFSTTDKQRTARHIALVHTNLVRAAHGN